MSNLLTIQTFSEQTGISKSTLRYYESIDLVCPERSKNGYRLYLDEQIATAKLIASLRVADVSIRDIKLFLQADKNTQQKMMQQWIQVVKERKQQLEVSLRYLDSNYKEKKVYLIEKDAEKVIWFVAESEAGNFGEHLKARRAELEQRNVSIKNGYLKYLSGHKTIKAQIGFGISDDFNGKDIPDMEVTEEMNACICIAISYLDDFSTIETGYRQLINYANEHNWVPAGSIFEWYRGDQLEEVDIVMPVTKMGGDSN